MKEWKLEEITYRLVRERTYEVAVLPVGATEPHGFHLPYGTDIFGSELLADRVCEAAHGLGARVIQLPTIPYGVDANLMRFPLTLHVPQSTLDAIVMDIVGSLEHHGILKLVLFNGHGGNDFKPFVRSLYGRTKVFVCIVDWWKVGSDQWTKILDTVGDHAGELETSVALELFGELVHPAEAGDGATNPSRFEAINREWVSITRPWHLFTSDSGAGDPSRATREKGKACVDVVVDRIGAFIKELSVSRMDEAFPFQ